MAKRRVFRQFKIEILETRDNPTVAPFTLVALPDTQHYASYPNLNWIFTAQTQWIVDHRVDQNIAFVAGLGDIVDHGSTAAEYQVADAAYDLLDGNLTANPNGLVPYAVPPGNHDYNVIGDRSSGADLYKQTFGPQRFQGRSWYGGSYLDKNSWQTFSSGGYTFLNLALEWEQTDDVIDWARQVVANHPGVPTIVETHSYAYDASASRRIVRQSADGNSGESLFRKLIYPNSQIFMVLNGHFHSTSLPGGGGEFNQVSINAAGQPVFEMLSDYQEAPGLNSGKLRLVRFDLDAGELQVKTYSPTQDQYETDADSQFTYNLNFASRFSAGLPDAVRVATFQEGVDFGAGTYFGTQDTQLRQATPTSPLGNDIGDLLIDFPDVGSTNTSQVLLRFDNIFGNAAGKVPLDSHILSATLIVDSNNPGAGAKFHRMNADWNENATWSSIGNGIQANGLEASTTYQSQVGTSTTTPIALEINGLTINVTGDVQAWASGSANRGWAALPWDNGTDGWAFAPSEAIVAEMRPRLRIEWVPLIADPKQKIFTFQQGVGGYSGSVDTHLSQTTPTTDLSTSPKMFVDGPNPSDAQIPLFRFDQLFGNSANAIRIDAQIDRAFLYLTTPFTDANALGGGGSLHRLDKSWTSAVTWSNSFGGDGVQADDIESSIAESMNTGSVDYGVIRLDVTADLRRWQAGQPNYGWTFLPNNTDGWQIASSDAEAIAERPRLFVVAQNLPPRVLSTQLNDGDPQRSRIASITINFSTFVTGSSGQPLTSLLFEIRRDSDGAIANANVTTQSINGRTVATLSGFTGFGTEFGSLADGRWTLRVRGTIVNSDGQFLDGNGDTNGGDDFATPFRRLFGDANGDGSVSAADFISFRLAIGGVNVAFDFDNDGTVSSGDFIQFRLRFGGSI